MIVIACDHGGYELKLAVMEHLRERGVEFEDIGCNGERVDYPVYAEKACRGVVEGKYERGILICGTGLGMSIAANKIPGIRCALLSDCYSAEMCRGHNDANMIAMGGRVIGPELAKRMVDIYLDTGFFGAQHTRRVEMLNELDAKRK